MEARDTLLSVLTDVLPGTPAAAIRETLPRWSAVQLREDAVLWKQGRAIEALACVVNGELDIIVDGTVIGSIRGGDTIDESAMLAQPGSHSAGVRARGRSQVLLLPVADIAGLRAAAHPVYQGLLLHTIACASRRTQQVDHQLGQMRKGNFAVPPPPPPAGLLSRLLRRMSRQPVPGACPPLAELLAGHPVLAGCAPEARDALFAAFQAVPFRAGDVLTRQGEVDTRVFVLAAGGADILLTVDDHGGALLLGGLEPGMIFGINAFISGSERSASVVASAEGWCHAMTQDAFTRLPQAARTLWLEVTLLAYVQQYEAAARALQAAIRVFASRHDEAMASHVMTMLPGTGAKPRKRR